MIIKPRQIAKTEPKIEKKEEPKKVEKPVVKQNPVKKAPRKIEEEEDFKFLFEDEENKE